MSLSDENPVPCVKITVEGLRHSIVHAFNRTQLQMDEFFRKAVDEACNPERLQNIITEESKKVIDEAVKAEVDSFYRYGDGREAVKTAVLKKLSEEVEDSND